MVIIMWRSVGNVPAVSAMPPWPGSAKRPDIFQVVGCNSEDKMRQSVGIFIANRDAAFPFNHYFDLNLDN